MSEEETIQYQIEIPKKLWYRFRGTIDKNQTINDALEKMIKDRCKKREIV